MEAHNSVPGRIAQAGHQEDHCAEVKAWRERMLTDEAKKQYKARARLVENVNAQVKGRYGLTQLTVRGLDKVKSVALLVALAHNLAAPGGCAAYAPERAPRAGSPAQLGSGQPGLPWRRHQPGDSPVSLATTLPAGPCRPARYGVYRASWLQRGDEPSALSGLQLAPASTCTTSLQLRASGWAIDSPPYAS
jgi:hypothetical protein